MTIYFLMPMSSSHNLQTLKLDMNSKKKGVCFVISGALCSCLLPESLQVTTVKQLPEYHTCTGLWVFFMGGGVFFCLNFVCLDRSSHPYISLSSFFFLLLSRVEEDGTESSSTATHESAESDEDQDKGLLSPSAGNSDVTFIKERSKGDIILPSGNWCFEWVEGGNPSFAGLS